jgi:hypothetical protein
MVPADHGTDADLAGISASDEHRLGIPYLQVMTIIQDLCIAYRAVRDSRRRSNILMLSRSEANRAAKQAGRLALMTEDELRRCAAQWGGRMAHDEARRRGLV